MRKSAMSELPVKPVPEKLERSAKGYYAVYGPPGEWVYQVLARQDLMITKLWWAFILALTVAGILFQQYGKLAKWWN